MSEQNESNSGKPSFLPAASDASSADDTRLFSPNSRVTALPGTMVSQGVPENTPDFLTVPAPPLAPPPESGKVIDGKYELLDAIASGGMGRVFRARHLQLRTLLAIKVMHDFIAANPEHVERFRREALAASKLDHPNVVRILDYGKLDNTLYIVMEFLEGKSLGDWLESFTVPPPLSEILPLLLQILDALIAAHELGIIHRDLKPDNVIISRDAQGFPTLKVVDFGLARFRDTEHNDTTITTADAVAGTPAYMSPEQCRSLRVTHSTDLYAFGCVLTELLQLTPPFAGDTVIDTISKHMFSPVPPLARPDGCEPVPVALERLRRDLLAKLPAQRPADAQSTRDKLVAAFGQDGGHARSSDQRSVHMGGTRQERLPEWNRQAITLPDVTVPAEAKVGYLAVDTVNAAVDEACLLGLRAQNYTVDAVDAVSNLQGYPVALLDFCADADAAASVTREVRGRFPELRIVVCVHGLTTALMNQFIEAGADDVARGPVTSDGLGRKLNRLLRRRAE